MFRKSILAAAVALVALALAADPGAAQPRLGGGGFRPQGAGPGGGGGFVPQGRGFVPQPGPGPGFHPGPGPGPGYGPGWGPRPWGPRPWGWGGVGLYPWGWGVPLGYYGYWGSYPTFDEVDDMPCLRKVWLSKKRWTWRRVC